MVGNGSIMAGYFGDEEVLDYDKVIDTFKERVQKIENNTRVYIYLVPAESPEMVSVLKENSLNQGTEVEGRNAYNLEISKSRLEQFFRTALRFVELEQSNTDIHKLVLWLLGDNVTGWLHEEMIHTCLLPPVEAAALTP